MESWISSISNTDPSRVVLLFNLLQSYAKVLPFFPDATLVFGPYNQDADTAVWTKVAQEEGAKEIRHTPFPRGLMVRVNPDWYVLQYNKVAAVPKDAVAPAAFILFRCCVTHTNQVLLYLPVGMPSTEKMRHFNSFGNSTIQYMGDQPFACWKISEPIEWHLWLCHFLYLPETHQAIRELMGMSKEPSSFWQQLTGQPDAVLKIHVADPEPRRGPT